MTDYLNSLNREQKLAVTTTEGPLLLLAGAGSGKTRVLTHRIAYLIDQCGVNPWHILAITFTNKAAGEMRERVDKLVGFGSESIWVSTFHSACVRILRRHIDLLGYDTNFTIYDPDDQKTIMKEVCKKLQIDTKQTKERTILGMISSAKNELVGPTEFAMNSMGDFKLKRIADAYIEYQQTLKKNNALDFDDLIMKTVELFKTRPDVLENYQNRFHYIMVDEYQDTNTAQFELVRLLASAKRNLCVVGDDDQSIYKFRGANIRNILDFEKVYPEAQVIKLEQNYRSTQNILDAANGVIKNNVGRKEKSLWTDHGAGNRVHFRQFDTAFEEAEFIADDIARKCKSGQAQYGDFAILYRTNAQARILEERMVADGLPYDVVGGTNFYSRREIKDVLAYLKTIDNGQDDVAVKRIINVPKRGIGATTIQKVQNYADEHGISFYDALRQADQITSIGRSYVKLQPFVNMIQAFRSKLEFYSLSELMEDVLDTTGYLVDLQESDEEDADDRIENVEELVSKVVSFEESKEEPPSLSEFLEEVALVADIDKLDDNGNHIVLMTLHSAKGLEFPYVYLSGMEDGIFPSYMTIISEDPQDIEEERRLAYVGITRAKEDLTLTCAKMRMIRGETQYNAVSRFVKEIPSNLLDGTVPSVKRKEFDDYDSSYMGKASLYGGTMQKQNDFYQTNRQQTGYSGSYNMGYAKPASKADSTTGKGIASLSGIPGLSKGVSGLAKAATGSSGMGAAGTVRPGISGPSKMGGAGASQANTPGTAPDYGVGDRVYHQKFGEGTVLQLEAGPRDYQVTVEFDTAGKRVMYATFAKLKKRS